MKNEIVGGNQIGIQLMNGSAARTGRGKKEGDVAKLESA